MKVALVTACPTVGGSGEAVSEITDVLLSLVAGGPGETQREQREH